jgi:hypothetical protein
MPVVSSLASVAGYGRMVQAQIGDGNIVAGNATTTMNTTGGTVMPGISGVDDSFAYIPTDSTFPFFFFGTNYGSGAATGIYWNTNNVLGFSAGTGTIQWTATTGRGILCGNFDRRCDPNALYWPIQSIGSFRILRFQANFRNVYNAGTGNEGRMEVRMIRDTASGRQYIEFRIFKGSGSVNGGAITTAGYGVTNNNWNITNGTTFQNTYGTTFLSTFPRDNTSHVLSSDSTGTTWTFNNTSYVNI